MWTLQRGRHFLSIHKDNAVWFRFVFSVLVIIEKWMLVVHAWDNDIAHQKIAPLHRTETNQRSVGRVFAG